MAQTNGPVLITGGNGNLGRLLARKFLDQGISVISFDLTISEMPDPNETCVAGDIRDTELLRSLIKAHKPMAIVHLASLLSGSSAADPLAAWEINATASFALMNLAAEFGTGPFVFASTMATFGTDAPKDITDDTLQWPTMLYGATKVAVERAGIAMKTTHGLDFRCLRFPMVLSPFAPPGAVTAYPARAFEAAVAGKNYSFPVDPDAGISTLFVDDIARCLFEMALADPTRLKTPAYNIHSFHFTAQELGAAIQKRVPGFRFDFDPDPTINNVVQAWPNSMDSTAALKEWDWKPAFDFDKSCTAMFEMVGL